MFSNSSTPGFVDPESLSAASLVFEGNPVITAFIDVAAMVSIVGAVGSFTLATKSLTERHAWKAFIYLGAMAGSLAAFGGGALLSVGVTEDAREEQAQEWVLEEHDVMVSDDLQDEFLDGDLVTGTVDGVDVTVRLVDSGTKVDDGRQGSRVFLLTDGESGEPFTDVEVGR